MPFLAVLVAAGCHSPGGGAPAAVAIDVPFQAGSWGLSRGAGAVLDATASALGDPRLAGARYDVRAYVAAGGAPGEAAALSRLRAAAAVDQLAARGVDRARLEPQGMGADADGERIEVVRR